MKITTRLAQESDLESLYVLTKESLGYDYPQEKMMKKIENVLKSSKDFLLVAQIDQKIVGYVHANDYDLIYMDHLKNIMGIAVDPNYRYLGIGKMLLEGVEKWAQETGASGVRLVSGESRIGAHEFYKHCGYQSRKKQLNFMKLFNQ